MDRLGAVAVFVAVAEERSFVAAARRLGRSPATVTRAVAALEARLATRLFNRTTRSVALTDAGRRHLERCRRLVEDFEALETTAERERVEPSGLLTLTAPVAFGRLYVTPIVCELLRERPGLSVDLRLLDRVVSLVDEGIDAAVRIGFLPDSSLRARAVGSVRRGLYASPAYLASAGVPRAPRDLAGHAFVAMTGLAPAPYRWSFRSGRGGGAVALRPRLVVNTAEAAIEAATGGLGVATLLSYQADAPRAEGRLVAVLEAFWPPPIPIHVLHPAGRHVPAKVRAFVERAVGALRPRFAEREG
jgi:DNA-binding transcriptional LysR family regulator